jgi:uncharacterized protein (TIGR00297 family)
LIEALTALGASGLLSFGAWKRGSLSTSGGFAATGVGFTVWAGLGWVGFVALCGFFLTSTLLGRVGKTRKHPIELDYEKGGRRDLWQVLANGGVAAGLGSVLVLGGQAGAFPRSFGSATDEALALAALASLASANADTWATELGVLWPTPPRSLWTLARVPAGTSGAVSPGGLLAALAGAFVVAAIATLLRSPASPDAVIIYVTAAGFFGALLDSALGGLQRQFLCTTCGKTVEAKWHCDANTTRSSPRFAVLNNDGVNVLANAGAAAIVLLLR